MENDGKMLCGRNQFGAGFEKKGESRSLTGPLSKCFQHHSREQSFVGGLMRRGKGQLCYRLVNSKEAVYVLESKEWVDKSSGTKKGKALALN